MRARACCGVCAAAALRVLAFVQLFAGVAAALYAAFALGRWARRGGVIDLEHLPEIWFEGLVMGAGMAIILIAIAGYVATETRSRFFLCFYAFVLAFALLLEAHFISDLLFKDHWKEVLPYDRSGELRKFQGFVQNNMDACLGVLLVFLLVQILSLCIAVILRAFVLPRRVHWSNHEDYCIVISRPLLIAQSAPMYSPSFVDGREIHWNYWNAQMQQEI